MEKVLNQEEIDAMFRAALGRGAGGASAAPSFQRCDFKQAGQIKKDQVRAISNLHEGFARNLTHALGAYLRVGFEVRLVSVEQLAYREFLPRVPDLSYLASFEAKPSGATALLNLEPSLVFPIIDLLLGGVGRMNEQPREITEIEEGIMESVVRILCDELLNAWATHGLPLERGERARPDEVRQMMDYFASLDTPTWIERIQPTQLQRLMPPGDKTLCLSFEIHMPESHGVMNVCFPAVASNALLRKLDLDGGYSRHRAPSASRARMTELALGIPFEFTLRMPATRLPIRMLLELKAGDVVALPHRMESPIEGIVGGQPLYEAFPIRSGAMRASRVAEMLPIATEEEQESA